MNILTSRTMTRMVMIKLFMEEPTAMITIQQYTPVQQILAVTELTRTVMEVNQTVAPVRLLNIVPVDSVWMDIAVITVVLESAGHAIFRELREVVHLFPLVKMIQRNALMIQLVRLIVMELELVIIGLMVWYAVPNAFSVLGLNIFVMVGGVTQGLLGGRDIVVLMIVLIILVIIIVILMLNAALQRAITAIPKHMFANEFN
jgi:hypothetical protein